MIRIPSAPLLMIATTLLVELCASAAHADTVVQVPLPGLLDARSVTTLTNGQLVPWTLPTDGGGLQNAFATAAVATLKGKPTINALPDDGHFPANARHPEVVLNFSNTADPTSPQTHLVAPSASFNFALPAATYSKLFLFFNGAAGGAMIKVTLTYTDGTEMQSAMVPDYYAVVADNDPVIFNLASNLAKYDKNSAVTEADHHNISGVELHPMAAKTLTGVQVSRGVEGNLVFWGATGIATSAVGGGGGGASAGGASSAGGSSGVGGAGGNGGAGGASGSAAAGSGTGGTISAGASSGGATGGASSGGTSTGTTAGGTFIIPGAPSDSGCGCRLGGVSDAPPQAGWLLLGVAGIGRVWRQRRRASAK